MSLWALPRWNCCHRQRLLHSSALRSTFPSRRERRFRWRRSSAIRKLRPCTRSSLQNQESPIHSMEQKNEWFLDNLSKARSVSVNLRSQYHDHGHGPIAHTLAFLRDTGMICYYCCCNWRSLLIRTLGWKLYRELGRGLKASLSRWRVLRLWNSFGFRMAKRNSWATRE